MTNVLMQFGDGSFKEIEVEATDPDEAVAEARDWVNGNAWFEAMDADGQDVAAETPIRDMRR